MHEGRLFRILYYLLEKGQTTAAELSRQFEVSVRTVYREIDTFSGAGIPVYTESGRGGGIRLMDRFSLDRAMLSEKEQKELLSALKSVSTLGNPVDFDILAKLSGLFKLSADDWFDVDFSRWGGSGRENAIFEVLKQAILSRKGAEITYVSAYAPPTERLVYPLKLLYKARAWYLQAYCTLRKETRTFKLSRILSVSLSDEGLDFVPQTVPVEPPAQVCPTVRLRFAGDAAARVYDEFDSEQVEITENGDLLVAAAMPEDAWLVGFVLSFGTSVQVLEPARLRDCVAEEVRKLYTMYQT